MWTEKAYFLFTQNLKRFILFWWVSYNDSIYTHVLLILIFHLMKLFNNIKLVTITKVLYSY